MGKLTHNTVTVETPIDRKISPLPSVQKTAAPKATAGQEGFFKKRNGHYGRFSRILYSAVGVSSGLTGIVSLSRCAGGACTSCFGCAGVGAGVILILLLNRIRQTGKEDSHGVA